MKKKGIYLLLHDKGKSEFEKQKSLMAAIKNDDGLTWAEFNQRTGKAEQTSIFEGNKTK